MLDAGGTSSDSRNEFGSLTSAVAPTPLKECPKRAGQPSARAGSSSPRFLLALSQGTSARLRRSPDHRLPRDLARQSSKPMKQLMNDLFSSLRVAAPRQSWPILVMCALIL